MINIVLCGGSGTRLWPLSRTHMPKQFVRLFHDQSLFQATILRNRPISSKSILVVNAEQYFLALDQFAQVSTETAYSLLEPVGRNTAPAIALSCLSLDEDDLVLVTPSDHLIKNQSAYEAAVLTAKKLAEQDVLVTFGIRPSYAETGFGYIEAKSHDVLSFKEKPDLLTAKKYLEQGNYYWNSGMFCFKAGVFLQELQTHSPEIYQCCIAAYQSAEKLAGQINIGRSEMQAIPDDSIDYAVMEKSDRVKVVPCDIGWSDLGSFDALYDETKTEQADNALIQQGQIIPLCVNAQHNLVVSNNRQVVLVEVDDLLVVDTADALLVARRGAAQSVKQVVEQLNQQGSVLTQLHRLVHRPWGTYEVLQDAPQYKVKRIVVHPGQRLSLQRHFHRNEHWIVVSGTAWVMVDDQQYMVRPNESTYIKMGQVHRLENHGKIDLVMIEVQVGEYTGEDDIERLDDNYGRLVKLT